MGVLDAFERRLGGLVEGAFAKVFKGEVQPVEIASALQREADDKRTVVAADKVLVPNDYVVELGDHDHERLEEWIAPLGDELAAMVREHAAERGYSFVGPVTVGFDHLPDISTGVFRIRSGVAAAKTAEGSHNPLGAAAASDVAAAGGGPRDALEFRPRLVVTTGGTATAGTPAARGEESTYFLTGPVTVIGRSNDCDLSLSDPGISRRHAEIRRGSDDTEIVDLGSTNGLRVNGRATARKALYDGDRIDLGSTSLIFRQDQP